MHNQFRKITLARFQGKIGKRDPMWAEYGIMERNLTSTKAFCAKNF